jgi:hypothetical protein
VDSGGGWLGEPPAIRGDTQASAVRSAPTTGLGTKTCPRDCRAMGGAVEFKEALRTRLDVIQPSHADVERILREHPHRVTKGRFERLAQRVQLSTCSGANSRLVVCLNCTQELLRSPP